MGIRGPYIVLYLIRKVCLGSIYFLGLTAVLIGATGIGRADLWTALTSSANTLTSVLEIVRATPALQGLLAISFTIVFLGTVFALLPGTRIRQVRIIFKAKRQTPENTVKDFAGILTERKTEAPKPLSHEFAFRYGFWPLFRREAGRPMLISMFLFWYLIPVIILIDFKQFGVSAEYLAVPVVAFVIVWAVYMHRIWSWIDFLKEDGGVVISRNGIGYVNLTTLTLDLWQWNQVFYIMYVQKRGRPILHIGTRWLPPPDPKTGKFANIAGTYVPVDLSLLRVRPDEVFAAVNRVMPDNVPVYFSGKSARKTFRPDSFENRTSAIQRKRA